MYFLKFGKFPHVYGKRNKARRADFSPILTKTKFEVKPAHAALLDASVLCLFDLPTSTTALRSRLEPDLPTYHHPPDGPGVPDLPTYPLLHCKKGCNISATKAWVSEGPSSIGWVLVIGPAHS